MILFQFDNVEIWELDFMSSGILKYKDENMMRNVQWKPAIFTSSQIIIIPTETVHQQSWSMKKTLFCYALLWLVNAVAIINKFFSSGFVEYDVYVCILEFLAYVTMDEVPEYVGK